MKGWLASSVRGDKVEPCGNGSGEAKIRGEGKESVERDGHISSVDMSDTSRGAEVMIVSIRRRGLRSLQEGCTSTNIWRPVDAQHYEDSPPWI